MESIKFMKTMKFLLIAYVAVLSVTSCKKDDDDDKDPAFIGTWSRTETLQIEDFSIEVKDIFTFTRTSVTNLGQMFDPDAEEWLDIMGMKANIEVDGKAMDVSVTSVGLSDVDDYGIPTGNIIYFDDQDEEFEAILAEVELEPNFEAEYSVSGNSLTLKTDDNGDGDFSDEGETQVYTKE